MWGSSKIGLDKIIGRIDQSSHSNKIDIRHTAFSTFNKFHVKK